MNLAVVILNWNGVKHLRTYLPSVIKYSNSYRIIVADNGSTDDSIQVLKNDFPTVEIIELKENFGFCKGYNEALKQVDTDFYILLNSDVEVTENWIEPIFEMMQKDNSIGACQPKLLSWTEKNKFEYAGAAGGFIDIFGYPFCRGRIFDSIEEDKGQYNDELEIMWATGACMFVRSDLYHKLEGLDSYFFAHMEEIDLCWRIKNEGFKVMYNGKSTVYHLGGGTLPHKNPKKTFLNFRNSLFLLYKNLPLSRFFFIIFPRLILDGLAGIKFLFSGDFGHFFAVLKAHFAFYYAVIFSKVKRKKSVKQTFKQVFNGSIALNHIIKKVKNFNQLNFS